MQKIMAKKTDIVPFASAAVITAGLFKAPSLVQWVIALVTIFADASATNDLKSKFLIEMIRSTVGVLLAIVYGSTLYRREPSVLSWWWGVGASFTWGLPYLGLPIFGMTWYLRKHRDLLDLPTVQDESTQPRVQEEESKPQNKVQEDDLLY